MPKRIKTFILLSLIGLSFLFVACSSPSSGPLTLAIGGPPAELEVWDDLIQAFEKQSGIDVEIHRQTANTDQRRQGLLVALKARQSDPDVFLMDVGWIAQFSASNWLLPLDSLIQSTDFSTGPFIQNIIELADTYKKQLIALPVYIDGGLLYFRKDLLKKYGYSGPPSTWQELIEISLKIQQEERIKDALFYGFVWQGAQYEGLICDYLEFAVSNGFEFVIKDHRIQFDTPQNRQALQLMQDLIHHDKISPPNTYSQMKEEDVRAYFQQGHALFERNWPYAWPLHQSKDSAVRNQVGIAPLPHFPGGQSVSTLGGWHAGISAFSDQKKQAWKLLTYMTSYEVQKKLALQLGWNPGRRDVYNDPEIREKLPHLQDLKPVFDQAIPRPVVPYYSHLSAIAQKYINAFLSKRLSLDESIRSAESEMNMVIAEYEQ